MAVKTSGTGAFLIPTAPAVGTTVTGGAANTFTTNAVQLIASTAAAIFITGLHVQLSSTSKPTYVVIRLSTGAGDGSIVGEYVVPYAYTAGATGTQMMGFVPINPWIAVAASTRIGAKSADSVGSLNHTVILQCINQSNVVAEGAIAETVDVLKWNGTAVSAPATAGIPDVNVKNIDNDAASASGTVTFPNATLASTTNITSATGVDITKILGTAISTPATAGILDVNVKNIDNDAASASGTVTFPNATLASTTNITAATGVRLSATGVDDVWDEAQSGHTTAGTFGRYVDSQLATIQADTDNIQTRLPAALSGDGFMKADLKSIEDELTSGYNATLKLKQVDIQNSAGTAFSAQSTGGNGDGAFFRGDGTGYGMDILSAGSGVGLGIDGGSLGNGGTGVVINGHGIRKGVVILSDTATGLYIEGLTNGVEIYGDTAEGVHIEALDGDQHGINIIGIGTGKSINAPQDIALPSGDLDDQLQALPTATENASQVRTELTTELGRIDVAVSSRSSHSAADVWSVGTRTLTSFGTLVSDIWSNATRTLTAISDSAGVTTLLTRIASALNISSGKVESNVKQINDTDVTGDGSTTPWGPA